MWSSDTNYFTLLTHRPGSHTAFSIVKFENGMENKELYDIVESYCYIPNCCYLGCKGISELILTERVAQVSILYWVGGLWLK